MKVVFKYDLDKDVLNFIKGTKSVNSSEPTKFTRLFQEKFLEVSEENVSNFIKNYLQENNIDTNQKVGELRERWENIEWESISRLERIFGIKYPADEITTYLTTNERCTYNIKEGFFFVNMNNIESNRTVLHELFHFYTWYCIHENLIKNGMTEIQYNDIKESLTVLLNTEFGDLLNGAVDRGYPQHQETRKKILDLWESEKDINKLSLQLI